MLKKFIACRTPRERFQFFDNSGVSNWTVEELEAVAEITGTHVEEGSDKGKIYMTLLGELSNRARQIA